MPVSATPTKFDAVIDALSDEYVGVAIDMLSDLDKLTKEEHDRLITLLVGERFHCSEDDFFRFADVCHRLGVEFMQVDLTSESSLWYVDRFLYLQKLVHSMTIEGELQQLEARAFEHFIARTTESADELQLSVQHGVIVGMSLPASDGSGLVDYFVGVPEGGFVKFTPESWLNSEGNVVTNLHFHINVQLGDAMSVEHEVDGDVYDSFMAAVLIEDGRMKLLRTDPLRG